ncbi:MAG: nucleoside kinase [Blautia sp.]|nr:nucleoside kinase [Blautia sp.]
MEEKKIRVTVNEETREFPKGISYGEIVKEFEERANDKNEYAAPVILVMANGKLRELHKYASKDCTVSFITTRDTIGHKTYDRSACMILYKAIYDVAGKENVENIVIHFSLGNAYYFTIQGNLTLDQEFLRLVKERMTEIVAQQIPIRKRSVNTEEAMERFHNRRMYDKEKLLRYRRCSKVNLYSIEDYEDYYYGFMAHHTGYIRYFDLQLYQKGFVMVLPDVKEPTVVRPFVPMDKMFHVQELEQEWEEKMHVSTIGDLNERIAKEGAEKLILIQEALQEAKIASIADQIVSNRKKKLVMIAGPSSSGKTSFSNRLCIQLEAHGLIPHLISVDNYFVDREQTPLDEFGEKNYECLEAIDVELFNQDALRLLRGEKVELPEFNFKTGHREYKGNYLQFGEQDVLVIEGIHGLNDKMSYALPEESKFKIYISALSQINVDEHNRIPSTDGRLLRRITRDARTRGTSAQETIARWPSVRRGEEENIFVFQENADVIINSALVYELACLKVYVEPLLYGIDRNAPEYVEAKRLLKFLDYIVPIPSEQIPYNSLLREFVGGSVFNV